jgi:hypothetical protein
MPRPSKFDDVFANAILDANFGSGTPTTWYLAALKVSDVEVTAAGYVRLAVANNTTNFPAASSRTKLLNVIQQFVAANPAIDWGTVESIGFFTVSTGGTRQLKICLAGLPANFTAPAATSTFTSAAHGFVSGQRVRVDTLPGLSLPGGFAAATDYYIVASPTTNTFQLAATAVGGAITVTSDGAGIVFIWRSKDISDGDILNLNAADLQIVFQ